MQGKIITKIFALCGSNLARATLPMPMYLQVKGSANWQSC